MSIYKGWIEEVKFEYIEGISGFFNPNDEHGNPVTSCIVNICYYNNEFKFHRRGFEYSEKAIKNFITPFQIDAYIKQYNRAKKLDLILQKMTPEKLISKLVDLKFSVVRYGEFHNKNVISYHGYTYSYNEPILILIEGIKMKSIEIIFCRDHNNKIDIFKTSYRINNNVVVFEKKIDELWKFIIQNKIGDLSSFRELSLEKLFSNC